MRAAYIFVAFFLLCGKTFAQDLGTALLSDARFDQSIGKQVSEFSRSVSIVPVTEDSVKRRHYPYNIYARLHPDKPLSFAGKYPVDEIMICVGKSEKISAIILYVQGDADSLYSLLKEKYGLPRSRFYLNTDEAFGLQGKPINHLWKIDEIILHFTLNTFSKRHLIAVSNSDVDDYMKTKFEK